MKRREFIAGLGAAATWPLVASAQQQTMPVIGYLDPTSPDTFAHRMVGFRQGLKETGYVEGENVAIVYRFAENQVDRLPELATDLVRRQVSVIVTLANGALAAKAVTTTIPIVFIAAEDPVKVGLVSSLSRPGGNLTGINFLSAELVAKRLELVHELVPAATRIAVLVNPTGPTERPDALLVDIDPFFTTRRMQLVHLASHHRVPAAYAGRQFAEVGGLMSYGSNLTDAWRQVGTYTGRLLKGAKAADLPVLQASKFELVINAETARMLGLTVSPSLLARADEVIE
jgi:putative tryptophan/tyrosine transport system substrate-binding protein